MRILKVNPKCEMCGGTGKRREYVNVTPDGHEATKAWFVTVCDYCVRAVDVEVDFWTHVTTDDDGETTRVKTTGELVEKGGG